jgi:8-oxo-dGDP phosphatase
VNDASALIKPWAIADSQTLVQDKWINLKSQSCVDGQGRTIAPYYVLDYPDWVQVVCLTSDDEILLVEQYRHAAAMTCLELPGGAIDAGETPLQGAQRELLEETGIVGRDWVSLGALAANPALQTNKIHVFGCYVDSQSTRSLDETEEINCHTLDREAVRVAIKDQKFGQMLHVGSLHLASLAGFWKL